MLLSRTPGRANRLREKQNASLAHPGPGKSPPREAKCFSHAPRAGQIASERSKMLLSRTPGRANRLREKQNASLTRPGPGKSPPREAKCFSHAPRAGQIASEPLPQKAKDRSSKSGPGSSIVCSTAERAYWPNKPIGRMGFIGQTAGDSCCAGRSGYRADRRTVFRRAAGWSCFRLRSDPRTGCGLRMFDPAWSRIPWR